ncbi:helix-turn-helix transcriptional regulator [Actinokineospora guangxiensis]|uniref:helix-turn-helix transcriptional regulator n=1 Tax=Actinokineospora guangxiensis TaxID=1490288 RepID=UPI00367150EE
MSSGGRANHEFVDHLAESGGLQIVLHATGERLAELRRSRRDVVVVRMEQLDISEPLLQAVIGTDTRVVLVAGKMSDDQIYAAARHGVRGFAVDGPGGHSAAQAILETHRSGSWLPPSLGGELVRFLARSGAANPELTRTELDILRQVCDGALNSEIARRLCCTADNVKWHLKNVYRKLHVRNRAEAAAHAVRTGIVDI